MNSSWEARLHLLTLISLSPKLASTPSTLIPSAEKWICSSPLSLARTCANHFVRGGLDVALLVSPGDNDRPLICKEVEVRLDSAGGVDQVGGGGLGGSTGGSTGLTEVVVSLLTAVSGETETLSTIRETLYLLGEFAHFSVSSPLSVGEAESKNRSVGDSSTISHVRSSLSTLSGRLSGSASTSASVVCSSAPLIFRRLFDG
jgi:hypothetical protein